MRARHQDITVRTYVPTFLKITARDLDQWVNCNLAVQSQLPVLLRKLVNSTGQDLSLVDFPGYDNAERKGWDGRVDAGAPTPWVPVGKSGWEFGCNKEPKQKADGDYAARVKAIPPTERAEMTFAFVTPRKWDAKDRWARDKHAFGDWKFVRASDGSDLEQRLEPSIQAQAWLAETISSPSNGVHSLEEQWRNWSSATIPELSSELFAPSIENYKGNVKTWMESPPSSPLIVCGDSKLEALAFLYCLFEVDDPTFKAFKERWLVFSSSEALRKLTTPSPSFLRHLPPLSST